MSDRSQSRLPATGIRSRQTRARERSPDTLRQNERTSTDRNFEIVKNRLDALENKVRAYRREIKRHTVARVPQNDGDSKAKNPGQLSDWPILEMEREAQRIQKEVGAYAAIVEKGAR